jgi:hypothetical protein
LKNINFYDKEQNNEELDDDELQISYTAFLVDATGHLNSLNKEMQGKDKLITEMFDVKAFKLKF